MSQCGTTKKRLFEEKVRKLIAESEPILQAVLQFAKDGYVNEELKWPAAKSLQYIKELREMLNPGEASKKWEQIRIPGVDNQ